MSDTSNEPSISMPKSDPHELAARMKKARQHALSNEGDATILKKRMEAKKARSAMKNKKKSRSSSGENSAAKTLVATPLPSPEGTQFYAVRIGYYTPKAKNKSAPTMMIRSAIFLHWEDAQKFLFVDEGESGFISAAEYEAFTSIEDALHYLKDGEQKIRSVPKSGDSVTKKKRGSKSAKRKSPVSDLPNENEPNEQTNKKQKVAAENSSETEGEEKETNKNNAIKEYNDWEKMFAKALEYKEVHGSTDIPEGEKGAILLRRWLNHQCLEHHNFDSLSSQQIEKLELELGHILPPSWEDMYDRLVVHRELSGTLDVNREDGEDELYTWVKVQKRYLAQHFQGKTTKLDIEKLTRLKDLGYAPSRPGTTQANGIHDSIAAEAKWNHMLEKLVAYKERNNGSMTFPERAKSLPQDEKALCYWTLDQRKQFQLLKNNKPSTLTAQRMQRLAAIGFDLSPTFEYVSWDTRIEQLRKFVEENGHCRPSVNHPELGTWVSGIRSVYKDWIGGRSRTRRGKKITLTEERVNELTELGFVFVAGKSPQRVSAKKYSWEERFEELLEFKEAHGNTIVPQKSGPLGEWVRVQRVNYKKFKAGKSSAMTAEKALRLAEIGFCFDASARFSGNKE